MLRITCIFRNIPTLIIFLIFGMIQRLRITCIFWNVPYHKLGITLIFWIVHRLRITRIFWILPNPELVDPSWTYTTSFTGLKTPEQPSGGRNWGNLGPDTCSWIWTTRGPRLGEVKLFQLEFVILILIFRANPWAYDLSNNNNNNDQMSRKSSELNERVGDLLEDEFGEERQLE